MKVDFSAQGLKGFIIFLTLVMGIFYYLQFNGIKLFSNAEEEHEGKSHSYGSHHK
jgi:hypothetical protein